MALLNAYLYLLFIDLANLHTARSDRLIVKQNTVLNF